MNTLRAKINARKNVAGTHVTMTDPCISEIVGNLGFDFLWIDLEHTAMDLQTLYVLLMGARATGVATLVRVPQNDFSITKRVLEMGPDGIIFPMVNTPEEADKVMKACLYPPIGTRGFGPIRAVRYGLDENDTYVNKTSRDICRFIQIESETAVKNLPEIMQNPYIDGYIFGPNDMSGSIGELGHMYGANTTALIDSAIGILKAADKLIGVSTASSEQAVFKYWHDKGIQFISAGVDYLYILEGAKHVRSNLRSVQEKV